MEFVFVTGPILTDVTKKTELVTARRDGKAENAAKTSLNAREPDVAPMLNARKRQGRIVALVMQVI